MGKNRKQNPGNQNNGNAAAKPAKKPGFFTKVKTWPSRHPRISKAVRITTKVVGTGLAAVGGAGLIMAVNDRTKKQMDLPEMPAMPDVSIPEPAPVDYPTED